MKKSAATKGRGVPVWSHDGLICAGETYKSVVKLTFAKGASLKDPSGLFNASPEGNARRARSIYMRVMKSMRTPSRRSYALPLR